MITQTKDYNELIKANIKSEHANKFYNEDDLPQIINSMKEYILKQYVIEDCELTLEITQYLYYSSKDNSFYFNSNKKQTKLREYHNKILNKINIFVNTGIDTEIQVQVQVQTPLTQMPQHTINKPLIDKTPTYTPVEEPVNKLLEIKQDVMATNYSHIHTPTHNIIYNPNNLSSNPPQRSFHDYKLPIEPNERVIKRIQHEYEPFGTDWIHDVQLDDPEDEIVINNRKQFDILRAVVLPEQRSPEWYAARDKCITASDCAQALNHSKYNPQYEFILKKTTDKIPFVDNRFVHHGKKYEDIANLIYDYRLNAHTEAFGLMPHTKYSFLGASPDAIVSKYKYDKIHKTKYVGTMVEIKCVVSRTILTYHDVVEELGTTEIPYETLVDKICPRVYFDQIQLQLETCDLDQCHFWQCNLNEYEDFEEFINDTDPNESFRSKETKFEKGCLIQLLPKSWICDILRKRYNNSENNFIFPDEEELKQIISDEYENVVISSSKYIYPPAAEMSPYDCQSWVNTQLEELKTNPDYDDYVFDKVIYWKLVKSSCFTINRDKEWFKNNLPDLEKIWSYITFLRKPDNKQLLDIFCDYIDTRTVKRNKQIMEVLDKLFNSKTLDDIFIKDLLKDINEKKDNNRATVIHVNSDQSLNNSFSNSKSKVKQIKRVTSVPKPKLIKKDPENMFDDDTTNISVMAKSIHVQNKSIPNKSIPNKNIPNKTKQFEFKKTQPIIKKDSECMFDI